MNLKIAIKQALIDALKKRNDTGIDIKEIESDLYNDIENLIDTLNNKE